ncbi:4-hydroxy-tetrahydrodipicolinate synthase [Micrococcoides hystricis]|uniref:4-hydroxy-tetrahydrodipicolinate synthase n=1 Tax=Micrococcoides hystricis TaxID=1572761 RepID=A0ABV6P8M0_9MICC
MGITAGTSPHFGRLITAMVTPFKDDQSIDFDAFAALANKLVDEGNDALVISGTTGETSTLEDQEKEDLFRAAVEAVGDRAKIIAGTGTNHTSHSVEMAKRAAKAGAHGQLVVTPYYNKPSQEGIIAHVEAIAEAADLPVMVYDIPGRSGVPITTESHQKLAQHSNIVALKDAKGDFTALTEVLGSTDLDVYSGDDLNTLAWMAAGGVGVVSVTAHVAAPQFRTLIDAMVASDLDAARQVHFELEPVIRGIMTRAQGAVAAKTVLAAHNVIPTPVVRLPLVQTSQAEHAAIAGDLKGTRWQI